MSFSYTNSDVQQRAETLIFPKKWVEMKINPPMLLQISRSYIKLVKADNFQLWFGRHFSNTVTPTTNSIVDVSLAVPISGSSMESDNSMVSFLSVSLSSRTPTKKHKAWKELILSWTRNWKLTFLCNKFQVQCILAEEGNWFNMGFEDCIVFFLAKFMFLESSLRLKSQRSILGQSQDWIFVLISFLFLCGGECWGWGLQLNNYLIVNFVFWFLGFTGLSYEYRAVNLGKGEQFTSGILFDFFDSHSPVWNSELPKACLEGNIVLIKEDFP